VIVKRGHSRQNIKLTGLLDELRKRRNNSIVAHGMRPVNEDDAVNSMEAVVAVMKEFMPMSIELIENYPLELTQVKKTISVLDKAFAI